MSRFRDDNIEENINDRKPPQNVDLEMCVLGGIMLEPQGAMPLVIPILRPEDFYLDGHGVIFELALDLYDRGIPPDSIALMDELRARGQVERVGGSAVVMGMLNSVPTAANVEYHARKVAEKGRLRRIIRTCTEMVDECYRQELDSQQVSDRLYQAAVTYQVEGPEEDMHTIAEAHEAFYEQQSKPLPAIPTGYTQLDRVTSGGLAKGQLHAVMGLTTHGKTAFLLNMLMHQAAGYGIPCLIFSIEMSKEQLFARLATAMTLHLGLLDYTTQEGYHGVNNYKLRGMKGGELEDPNLREMLHNAQQHLVRSPISIVDSGYMTPARVRKAVLKFAKRHKDFVVYIDYYQILEGDEKGQKRTEKLQEASLALRRLAKDIGMPVVVAAQIRRGFTGNRPTAGDVEDSYQITKDAYTCIVIDQPHMRDTKRQNTEITTLPADAKTFDVSKLYLDKNRNGQAGVMLQYHYVGPVTRFVELQPSGNPEIKFDWARP